MAGAGDAHFGMSFDEQGCLTSETPCIKCGYNLRTIHRDAACPECGTAVGRSIFGNRLRYCDPKWLKHIWEGMNLFALSALFLAAEVVLHILADLNHAPLIVTAVTPAIVIGLLIYGFVKATRPDPSRIEQESPVSARRLARGAWLIVLAMFLLMASATALREMMGLPADFARRPMIWCGQVMLLCFWAGAIFLLRHAAVLAKRLPRKVLAIAIHITIALLLVVALWMWVLTWSWMWDMLDFTLATGTWWIRYRMEDLTPFLFLALAVVLVVIGIWYWWALSRAAKFAWTTWAKRNTD